MLLVVPLLRVKEEEVHGHEYRDKRHECHVDQSCPDKAAPQCHFVFQKGPTHDKTS
jgi:hypothetical protein